MIVDNITINGKPTDIELIIGNEFAKAFSNYNFKSIDELNELYQMQARCTDKGLHSWCPSDTETLKQILGMET